MQYLIRGAAANSTRTGTTAIGSAIITAVSTTVGLSVGQFVTGTGIPANTSIVSIDSATQITLSKVATANGVGVTLTFFTPVNNLGDQSVLTVYATSFGGGTITVEGSPDGGTSWITLTQMIGNAAATFTANAYTILYRIPQGHWIRARLTGATNPSGVYVAIGH